MSNDGINFASRMDELPPYLFGMINKMKMEKRRKGEDVIDLGMGNPVDPTPEAVIDKLTEVVKDPKSHRYPEASGMKHLKREISRYYKKDYDVDLNEDNEVICTIGSKEGISHMCLALVGPGDTVLVPAPAFPIHVYAIVIAGGNVIKIPMDSDEAFIKSIANMCESMVPKPKLLVLNYPHNPTGKLGNLDLFKEMVALAKKYNFMILQDFAYAKINFDGYVAPSILQVPGAMDV